MQTMFYAARIPSDCITTLAKALGLCGIVAITHVPSCIAAENPPAKQKVDATIVGEAWELRIIDNTSQGADGVKFNDVNGDGLPDIATGWEEGGIVRAYLHPGIQPNNATVKKPWSMENIGAAPDVEDAILIDLNNDQQFEVIASCEGKTQQVRLFHKTDQAWSHQGFPQLSGKKWMYAQAMQIDGQHGPDLVIGSKNKGAELGWLQAPADPLAVDQWQWHPLTKAGWIMSIYCHDIDKDGDLDIVYSDRRGPKAGVWWLEQPDEATATWPQHRIWQGKTEVMSFGIGDIDQDGRDDFTVALGPKRSLVWLRQLPVKEDDKLVWESIEIPIPGPVGDIRDAVPGDLDGDGDIDLAITTWKAADLHGVIWLENTGNPLAGDWRSHAISGTAKGIKYDHAILYDIDQDGDLDVVTCEEHEADGGLGVIWYENPHAQ